MSAAAPGPRPIDARDAEDARELHLVERVRAGEVAAFELIFRTYYDQLYRFAFRYLRLADEADEAVQTVFARIWRNRTTWTVNGILRDYLYAAARNACRDRFRHQAVVERWRERARAGMPMAAPDPVEADELLRAAELEAAVERALAELPAKRRAICMLRLVRGLSYSDIAKDLGISPKTVETQVARGLKVVRERLRHFLD